MAKERNKKSYYYIEKPDSNDSDEKTKTAENIEKKIFDEDDIINLIANDIVNDEKIDEEVIADVLRNDDFDISKLVEEE